MGKAAEAAFDDLGAHLTGNMHGCILVKSYLSNTYFRNYVLTDKLYARYDKNEGHIELELFKKLVNFFDGFEKIPNKATIIIAARWSPCSQCLTRDIPDFLKWLDIENKEIKVKFRFDNYYSKAVWPFRGQMHLWESNQIAQSAYDEFSKSYRSKFDAVGLNDETGQILEREKRRVLFAPRTQVRTHILKWN